MIARKLRRRMIVAGLLLLIGSTSASAQTTRAEGSTTLDRVVSPRVVGTYVVRGPFVALLVLWRGAPGWFKNASPEGSSGSTASGGFYTQTLSVAVGGQKLTVEIDHTAGTAHVLGTRVSLTSSNVVLVDNVDGRAGPEVVDVIWIEPTIPAGGDPLATLFQRAPQLGEFLQCNAILPDIAGLSGFSTVCHRLFGR
jgi:hypothetical protein